MNFKIEFRTRLICLSGTESGGARAPHNRRDAARGLEPPTPVYCNSLPPVPPSTYPHTAQIPAIARVGVVRLKRTKSTKQLVSLHRASEAGVNYSWVFSMKLNQTYPQFQIISLNMTDGVESWTSLPQREFPQNFNVQSLSAGTQLEPEAHEYLEDECETNSSSATSDIEESPFVYDLLKCKFHGDVLEWQVCPEGVTRDQRSSDQFGMKQTSIRFSTSLLSWDESSYIDFWKLMFPWRFFFGGGNETECCLAWTNRKLPTPIQPFSVHEWVQFIGVLYAKTQHPQGDLGLLWSRKSFGTCAPLDFGSRFNVSRARFEAWKKHVVFWPPCVDIPRNNFDFIRPLIDAFNQNRLRTINPGTELVIDEGIGKWMPSRQGEKTALPHPTKIARKPTGIGSEYKTLAECTYGIMLHLELPQEGKEAMADSGFTRLYPKHTAIVLRVVKDYLDKGHVVYGDSAFASLETVRALLQHNTYFTGLLKNCHSGFPTKYLSSTAWQGNEPRGATKTVKLKITVNDREREVYGHAWNDPGRGGTPKKVLISSWNTTNITDGHLKKRYRVNAETGERSGNTFTLPRTQMVKSYFTAANGIDHNNQLRQGGLAIEDSVRTQDWRFRMLCTVLGIIEVDAFKAWSVANQIELNLPHPEFTDKLAVEMLLNEFDGAPTNIRSMKSRSYSSLSSGDDTSQSMAEQDDAHFLVPVKQFYNQQGGTKEHGVLRYPLPPDMLLNPNCLPGAALKSLRRAHIVYVSLAVHPPNSPTRDSKAGGRVGPAGKSD
eukprot:765731-Hanusia_phi.AAC.1